MVVVVVVVVIAAVVSEAAPNGENALLPLALSPSLSLSSLPCRAYTFCEALALVCSWQEGGNKRKGRKGRKRWNGRMEERHEKKEGRKKESM